MGPFHSIDEINICSIVDFFFQQGLQTFRYYLTSFLQILQRLGDVSNTVMDCFYTVVKETVMTL